MIIHTINQLDQKFSLGQTNGLDTVALHIHEQNDYNVGKRKNVNLKLNLELSFASN